MLRVSRIGRSVAQTTKPALVGAVTVRPLSTTQCLLAQKADSVPDRTVTRAFTKVGTEAKKLRSGTSTSVNLDNANPNYYVQAPILTVSSINAGTAKQRNVNRFLKIDTMFLNGLGKDRYPGYLGADFKLFGGPALLYREATQKLVDQLAQRADTGSKQASVIDGKGGSGKSAELLKLAAVAVSLDHLVIYAHATLPWVDSSRPYAPGPDGHMFVQHELAMELLQTVRKMNNVSLAKVPLGKDISFGKRSLSAKHSLMDMVDFALRVPSVAQDVLDHLIEIASKQTNIPVLIAVDDVNTLWTNTFYTDQNNTVLPASRLRLPSSFRRVFDGEITLKRGWAVGAMSYIRNQFVPNELKKKLHPEVKIPVSNPVLKMSPDLPGTAPINLPFEVISLDRMSTAETWALMNFYHKVSMVSSPVTDVLVAKKWITANGNPRAMFNSVTTYF